MNKERESNIELLRIFSALAVIILHYNGTAGLEYSSGINKIILSVLEGVSIVAVNVFILIAGYFLSNSDRRQIGKPLTLIVQVIVLSELMYLIPSVIKGTITLEGVVLHLFPDNYFVTLYCILYLISPYINRSILNLSKREFQILLFFTISIFSLWDISIDLINNYVLSKPVVGLCAIGIGGDQKGYTIVNFLLLYLIGAYLKRFAIKLSLLKTSVMTFIFVMIVILGSFCEMYFLGKNKGNAISYFYNSPFVIFYAVSLLLLFKNFKVKSGIINNLAKAAFMCYILQGYLFGFFNT